MPLSVPSTVVERLRQARATVCDLNNLQMRPAFDWSVEEIVAVRELARKEVCDDVWLPATRLHQALTYALSVISEKSRLPCDARKLDGMRGLAAVLGVADRDWLAGVVESKEMNEYERVRRGAA